MKTVQICITAAVLLSTLSAYAENKPAPLRSKIIKKQGNVQLWNIKTTTRSSFEKSEDLLSGTTLSLPSDASLHLTFEPLIDFILNPSTTLSFENLLIERERGVIRIKCTMESGSVSLKAPPQAGHTLLFTLKSPAATIDVSAAEITITVDKKGTTTVEVEHGNAKVLPHNSTLKTVLNSGSRGIIYPDKPHVQLSGISDTPPRKQKKIKMKQPSIAILSVKSSDTKKENLEHISNTVAHEFEKSTNATVLFLDDIKKLLHAEGGDRLLDCFTDSCISRIGARAGVDIVIVGNLGKLGSTHILDLKMVDVLRDKMLKRTSVKVKEDLGLILNEIPGAINNLVDVDTVLTSVVTTPATVKDTSATPAYKEKVVWIFPGTFTMGSGNRSGEVDELPKHEVSLDGFFIDRFEVTRDEFKAVMGYDPSSSKGCGSCPVTGITWQEAATFCTKTGKRLPTEAEWEYACRAGTKTPFYTGVTISDEQANFNAQKPYGGSTIGTFRGKVIPVGSLKPNSWNLHDMYGNAAEWCFDWYDVAYYGNSPDKNPSGPQKGKLKTVRGGSWQSEGIGLRSANRTAYNPELRLHTIGFRCVKPGDEKKP